MGLENRKASSVYEREFEFTPRDFEYIRKLVSERTGIVLGDHKTDLVYSRISRRLRQLKLSSFNDYLAIIEKGDDTELVEFTNALTTNLTAFFREPHHFDYLAETLLPDLLRNKQDKKLRIWSAGCSSGEEPYSIAMVVREIIPASWDVRILATDLDSNMVSKARAGVYTLERVEGISKQRLKRWVLRGKGEKSALVKMSSKLQELITFKQLNLMHEWPLRGPFDFIFCRNVVIYFDKETQKKLFSQFADVLRPDGHLFIGHSESLYKVSDRYKLIGKTIYQKIK